MVDRFSPDLAAAIAGKVETKTLGWEGVNVSAAEISLPEIAVLQGHGLVSQWSSLFVKENTWVQQNLGIPTVIARVDASLDPDGNLLPYEIEERPGGIGAATVYNPDFRERLSELKKGWPDFDVVVSEKRTGHDDGLWASVVRLEDINPDRLYLIRAEPEESEFHKLEPNSVSSLKGKGSKAYGVQMGLWKLVNSPDCLDWNKPFALKPTQGSKSRDVRLWDPDPKVRRNYQGYATETKIKDTLAHHGVMYEQDFLPPIELHGNEKTLYMIYRVFYGYDIPAQQWKYLGGFYNVRPSKKVHGARDTIFGPVVVNGPQSTSAS